MTDYARIHDALIEHGFKPDEEDGFFSEYDIAECIESLPSSDLSKDRADKAEAMLTELLKHFWIDNDNHFTIGWARGEKMLESLVKDEALHSDIVQFYQKNVE